MPQMKDLDDLKAELTAQLEIAENVDNLLNGPCTECSNISRHLRFCVTCSLPFCPICPHCALEGEHKQHNTMLLEKVREVFSQDYGQWKEIVDNCKGYLELDALKVQEQHAEWTDYQKLKSRQILYWKQSVEMYLEAMQEQTANFSDHQLSQLQRSIEQLTIVKNSLEENKNELNVFEIEEIDTKIDERMCSLLHGNVNVNSKFYQFQAICKELEAIHRAGNDMEREKFQKFEKVQSKITKKLKNIQNAKELLTKQKAQFTETKFENRIAYLDTYEKILQMELFEEESRILKKMERKLWSNLILLKFFPDSPNNDVEEAVYNDLVKEFLQKL
uniref:Uncharacterized protein n=1 Tax=Caenorhabditis japonica TaxID=281687 RepID=A0A8R1DIJ2_CAEJA